MRGRVDQAFGYINVASFYAVQEGGENERTFEGHLRALMETLVAAGKPFCIGGDFNRTPGHRFGMPR